MWVQLSARLIGERWAEMIFPDGVEPPEPEELKGLVHFADTAAEAERLAKAFLGLGEPANWRTPPVAQQGKPDVLVTLQELSVSNACEITALVAVPEPKGLMTEAEALEEINRLKARTGTTS